MSSSGPRQHFRSRSVRRERNALSSYANAADGWRWRCRWRWRAWCNEPPTNAPTPCTWRVGCVGKFSTHYSCAASAQKPKDKGCAAQSRWLCVAHICSHVICLCELARGLRVLTTPQSTRTHAIRVVRNNTKKCPSTERNECVSNALECSEMRLE